MKTLLGYFTFLFIFLNSCGVKGPPLPPIETRPDLENPKPSPTPLLKKTKGKT